MSGPGLPSRGSRRPDHWPTPHDRARQRLAERLDEPLAPDESDWLEEHLAGCESCRSVDADYGAQRDALSAMTVPEPPRDLWARTSAALELEERRRVASRGSIIDRLRSRPPFVPAGLVAVALVVAVVVGSTVLSSPGVVTVVSPPPVALGSAVAQPTPILVAAGDVQWLTRGQDGSYEVNEAPVDHVCPTGSTSGCATMVGRRHDLGVTNVQAKSVIKAPNRGAVVVVGNQTGSKATSIVVVPLAGAQTSPPPSNPTPTPTPAPTATPVPSPTIGPSSAPSLPPTASPAPSQSPALGSPTPIPAITSIVDNVTLSGQSAAYSPDGQWFAFAASPVDGSAGPDIYVWHVGDAKAHPITSDHRSVFSGWVGAQLLGSRAEDGTPGASPGPSTLASASPSSPSLASRAPGSPEASTGPAAAPSQPSSAIAASFLADPATGVQVPLSRPVWRPVVDPVGRLYVGWEGSLVQDPATGIWAGGAGSLVVDSWASLQVASHASSSPGPSPGGRTAPIGNTTPSPGASPKSSLIPDSSGGSNPSATPASFESPNPFEIRSPDPAAARFPDWDARWDASGEHLALWIADPADPTFGRLSLFTIDPATGRPDPARTLLTDMPALPGFAIENGRLVWALPPGQDGQGSRIQVLAWVGPNAGSIYSPPAGGSDGLIVVR